MRGPALIVAMLLSALAALAAVVIVAPSINQKMAFLAVGLGEKTFLIIAAAIAGGALAASCGRPGRWALPVIAMALSAFALGVSTIPPIQAMRLAREQHVSLDWGR